ncbi:8258_t:CDS:1, partial [Diversispora eburnea]
MVVIGNKRNKKAHNQLPQKKCQQWNVREKLMVLHYLENNGRNKCGTAKRFGVQPKQIHDWSNNKATLLETAPHVTKLYSGKPPKYPSLEDNLFSWISERRAKQNSIIRKIIVTKVVSLSRSPEFLENNHEILKFKFSNKCLDAFLTRYNFSECRRTTVAQYLAPDLIEKQNIFLSYILYRRIQHDYLLNFIGNMNKTPMLFDLSNNTTIDHK